MTPNSTPDSTPQVHPQSNHQVQYEEPLQNGVAYESRPTTSQSAGASYTPQTDINGFSNLSHQQNVGLQQSRPQSGLSDAPSRQTGGHNNQYQSNGQEKTAQNSVVIKVGMVGDAQIGKTSLMVKYVEGSWDEDYIQTLGECLKRTITGSRADMNPQVSTSWKRPSPSATQKSHFPSGIWVDSGNSSTCYH